LREDNLDVDHDHAPLRLRNLNDIIDDTAATGPACRVLHVELNFTSTEEPNTFREAEQYEPWCKAMQEEMKSIQDNNTWELTTLPVGPRAIGVEWVYKVKHNKEGKIIRHKARLVAKGYVQRASMDFYEVFAPVARLESVRMLVALAAHSCWTVHHMDVKSAFLNGTIKEEVYVHQPPGFVVTGKEGMVLRLRKALYGLRQRPGPGMPSSMSLGFQRSSSEHGIYTQSRDSGRLIIGVYVDDLIITGTDEGAINSFKTEMKDQFQMSDIGLLSYYLRIEVKQGVDGISLCQSAYTGKLLERCGMGSCNPCTSPMESRLKLSRMSTADAVDATEYRSLIRALRYLLHTWPDLAFLVGYLSRFMEAPLSDHLAVVKHLLRYVAGTKGHGLHYTRHRDGEPKLVGYNDADLAGDIDTGKSTTGIIFFLDGNPITWQASK
jgi:hypothetical protein